MKKRILTLALALAMCLGLAVPAFAADESSEPAAYRSSSEKSGIIFESKTDTYQAKYCDLDESTSAFTYGDAEDLGETNTFLIPKGVDLTLTGASPADFMFIALSDPDGDGTFSQRLFVFEPEKDIAAVPIPEGDVYTDLEYSDKAQFVLVPTAEQLGLEAAEDGSITLTSDFLYGLLDANSMLLVSVDDELGWIYMLSGEPTLISSIFTDVAVGQWFTDPVTWARQYGITNGTSATTFSLEDECTQLQILTFLYRAQRDDPDAAPSATDMVLAQAWALQKGMIDDTFDGSKPCTRATAVSYIWQAFDKPEAEKSTFTDVAEDADYADAVNWAVAQEITNGDGSDTIFSPDKTCTRGQIVTFLYRAYTA